MTVRIVTTKSVKAIIELLGIERDKEQIEELSKQLHTFSEATATLNSMDLTPYEPAIEFSVEVD